MAEKSFFVEQKKEIIAIILIVVLLLLIFLGWVVSLIPGNGFLLIALLIVVWTTVLVGKVVPNAPNVLKQFSTKLLGAAQSSIFGSVLFILISVFAISFRSCEEERLAEEIKQKQAIAAQQEQERKEQAEREKQEKIRNQKAELKFKTAKENYLQMIDDIKDAVSSIKKDEAMRMVSDLEAELSLYNSTSLVANPVFLSIKKEQVSLKEPLWRETLELKAKKILQNKSADISKEIEEYITQLESYEKLLTSNSHLPAQSAESKELMNDVKNIQAVLTAVHDLDAFKGQAEIMKKTKPNSSGWGVVIGNYTDALKQVTVLEEHQKNLRAFIPRKINLRRERKQIANGIAQAEKKKKVEETKEAKVALYRKLCGEQPTPDAWDGGIYQVEAVMKQVAHDPDSIDIENCTTPMLTKKNCWVTTCNVRGKNAFGAMILNRKTFSISALGVEEAR